MSFNQGDFEVVECIFTTVVADTDERSFELAQSKDKTASTMETAEGAQISHAWDCTAV